MKKSILILFVLLSQVCMGQSEDGWLTPGIIFGQGTLPRGDIYAFSSIDSLSSEKPEKIITIHSDYQRLNDKKKSEMLAKMEAWILSEKKKLKK